MLRLASLTKLFMSSSNLLPEDSNRDASHHRKDTTSRAESCHLHHACFHGNATPHRRHGHCHQQPPQTRRQFQLAEHTNQPSGGQQITQSGHRCRHADCVEECHCCECESLPLILLLATFFDKSSSVDETNRSSIDVDLCVFPFCIARCRLVI